MIRNSFVAATVIAAGVPLCAQAQSTAPVSAEAASDRPPAQVDIVVTAARTNAGQISQTGSIGLLGDQSVFDTPFSVTSYTSKLIEDQQARSLADVLANNPAIRSEGSSFSDGEDQVVRGFDVGSQGLYLNGVSGLIPTRRTPLEAIDRLDVLLGPNALLNADAPVGGSFSLTSKRAADAPQTRLTARHVNDSDLGVHADVGRRFGADRSFGIRVNLAYDHGDTPIDRQGDKYFLGSVGADWKLGGLTLSGDLIREYWMLRGEVRDVFLADGVPVPAAPKPSNNLQDKSSSFEEQTLIEFVKAEYAFSDTTSLSLAFGHNYYKEVYQGPGGGPIINAAGDVTLPIGGSIYEPFYTNSSAQARFRTALDTGPVHHQLVVSFEKAWGKNGTYYTSTNSGTVTSNIYRPIPLAPLVFDLPEHKPTLYKNGKDQSFAIADVATLFDGRLSVTAGVRHQQQQDQKKWTPAVAVLFKIVPRLSLYGNYIQALEGGPIAEFPAVNAGQIFPPSVTNQKEVGLKFDIGRAGLTLAAFEINRPDYYIDVRTQIFGAYGDTRSRGIELNAFGEIIPSIRLLGGASYYDTIQRNTADTDGDGRGDTDGLQVVGTQHVRINLGAEWDVKWLRGLTLTARGIYTSRTVLDPDNARSLPAWARLDAGARYTLPLDGKPLTMRLQVTNVTAKRYWQTSSQYFGTGEPRTVRLSLSKDF